MLKHPEELDEWLESFDDIWHRYGADGLEQLLDILENRAASLGVTLPTTSNTPYVNSISVEDQPAYPGDRAIERRIKSLIRWNAMAMVVQANRVHSGLGGHISSYASSATLFEVGFNHFFHGRTEDHPGDLVYFQGHVAPGIYARAFLEGRFTKKELERFRQEAPREKGLSSYPHPWLMPNFWQFPTVSMGLGPMMAIMQARFLRYLHNRGIADTSKMKVWCFLGDGETDEPETLGSISLASREKLGNLIFVVNCNLQRLDGPVRGNGKIIQELESVFRGAGWQCLKVIWGTRWDSILANDKEGLLVQRMNEVVDGQYQKYTVEPGAYIRDHFFGTSPELKKLVSHLTDEQLRRLRRGGHDPVKVFAAYQKAVNSELPTVILAKTVKGYGLGEAGEGKNITHQQKKLNEEELRDFRKRFDIPLEEEHIEQVAFYRPSDDSEEITYIKERREALGGPFPRREPSHETLDTPSLEFFKDFLKGSGTQEASSTMAFARMLGAMLKHDGIGKRIVPIVPDEARTFGLEALFRQCGIYASQGQLYEPVDASNLIYYREAKHGQILEEGINEAGAMSSFIAAGTAYANLGVPMVPFYIFYSMFGFQRVGDFIWAGADQMTKGFLLGATAGRTTLNGEGLQHQDGQSLLSATAVPNLRSYDPAFAYEVAVIIQDGLRRMYQENEKVFYYVTLYNENYTMPPLPEDVQEGIIKGMYRLGGTKEKKKQETRPQLFGSGPILNEVKRAQEILIKRFAVATDLWSITSFTELAREAAEVERFNRLHPEETPRQSFLAQTLGETKGPFFAATDHVRLVPEQIRQYLPGGYFTLGTDGFGRSDTREALRRHFEVSAETVAYLTLSVLADNGQYEKSRLAAARDKLGIDPNKLNPVKA